MSQSSVHESLVSSAAKTRHILSRCGHAVQVWLNRRHGRQDLSALDDRLLDDVGISREDALWKAGKPFWRS